MTNKIFIDSSVLIESYKGNKVDFYQSLFSNNNNHLSIYNLLPNDAIILATCKLHRVKLASHDSDFIIPCESENIELLRSSIS